MNPLRANKAADETMTGTIGGSGLTIEADDKGERRIIAGLAVPFGEVGFTSWGPTKFEPGALAEATGIPAVRSHDDDRLIGVVSASTVGDDGVHAKVKVSRIGEGDDVLVLAEDGALTGFSGQWRPTEYRFESDDRWGEVVVVTAAEWQHLSTVTSPAFDSARITKVAASRGASTSPPKEGPTVNLKQLIALLKAADASKRGELLIEHADLIKSLGVSIADVQAMLVDPVELTATLEQVDSPALTAAVAALTSLGERIEAGITAINERPAAPLPLDGGLSVAPSFRNAGDYAATALFAAHGRADDQARMQAALTTTATTDNAGIVPPFYSDMVLGNLPVWTPVLDSCVRHEPLPPTGMSIIKPSWTTLPEGDWYTSQNGEPATGAVAIGTDTVTVEFWSHAVRSSIALVERSTFGGFAQRYYEAALMSYMSDKEAKAIDTMLAAANNVSSVGLDPANPLTAIAALIEALIDNQSDANGNFRGLRPDFVGMDAHAFGKLIKIEGVFQFAQGQARVDSLDGSLAGIRLVLIPGLGHGDYLAGAQAATVVSDEDAVQLRSLIVNTNSYELGVLAAAAFDVEYPDALAKLTQGS